MGIFMVLIWVVCIFGCYAIGKDKGMPVGGLLLGVFLGLIGLLIIAVIPSQTRAQQPYPPPYGQHPPQPYPPQYGQYPPQMYPPQQPAMSEHQKMAQYGYFSSGVPGRFRKWNEMGVHANNAYKCAACMIVGNVQEMVFDTAISRWVHARCVPGKKR